MGGVRAAAALALLLAACADRVDGRTAEEWAAELANPEAADAAAARLAARGAEAADLLVTILESAPPRARVLAASLLARLGPGAGTAVPALAKALESEDRRLRGMAAIALGRIGDGARDALVPLDRALRDRDVRVRVAAALAIYGVTGDTAAPTQILFTTLTSPDPDVRAMVAEAFAEMDTPILDLLVRSLRNENEATRESAARTLGAMGPAAAGAKDALFAALDDPSEAVRAAASEALVKIE
jgi:HEAT repeat protein